jgi:hypothetical protein
MDHCQYCRPGWRFNVAAVMQRVHGMNAGMRVVLKFRGADGVFVTLQGDNAQLHLSNGSWNDALCVGVRRWVASLAS